MFKNINEENRQSWIEKTLARLPEGARILDAGTGELKNRQYCENLQYVSQDFCQYDGDGDQAALQSGDWDTSRIDIVSDITDIPVEDASFDHVLCSEVFEHIKYPDKALAEFYRILKPGGTVIITAPF